MTTTLGTRWPLELVLDARGAPTGWALVHAPVISPDRQEMLAALLRRGTRFVGMCSDTDFPRPRQDRAIAELIDYGHLCEAWCHCFRDPELYLPPGRPRILLSASDFTDYARVAQTAPATSATRDTACEARHDSGFSARRDIRRRAGFDFVYVGASTPWKSAAKGWDLAVRCLPVLCGRLGLRGLLVGPPPLSLGGVTIVPTLPWAELLGHLANARFLFAPNTSDASPRVLAEALSLDVPLLVSRSILGGWKYVTPRTGGFFDDEHDIEQAATAVLRGRWAPSAWFRTHHGPYLAGRALLNLLRSLDDGLSERSHLLLERGGGPIAREQ